MLLLHLQPRQLMAPPSFYRRRRLGSLPIRQPEPLILNFSRYDMGTYDGVVYGSISITKPGRKKNVVSAYVLSACQCLCNCILHSRPRIIRKLMSFCFWVVLVLTSTYDCTNQKDLDFYSPEASSQDQLRIFCDREPREEIGPTRTCHVKKWQAIMPMRFLNVAVGIPTGI